MIAPGSDVEQLKAYGARLKDKVRTFQVTPEYQPRDTPFSQLTNANQGIEDIHHTTIIVVWSNESVPIY